MTSFVNLGTAEIDAARPFTHLDKNVEDLAALRHMAESLLAVMPQALATPPDCFPLILEAQNAEGRRLRTVVARPERLAAADEVAVVGFFGQRREVVDAEIIIDKDTVDLELIQEFPGFPGVLSYSSLELACGNYGNLVILGGPEDGEHWNTSARHAYASRVIAPRYYNTIRLHNAAIRGGLTSGAEIRLLRTKYYEFQGEWPWAAVREYNAG